MSFNKPRYAPSRRALHWGIAVLMVLAYVFILGRENFERGSDARLAMVQAHFWVGIALLALMLPRLLLAFSRPAPAVQPPLPAWQALPAKAVHLLLYAMLVVQPLLGLGTAWTDGKDILLPFTQIALPALLAPDAAPGSPPAGGDCGKARQRPPGAGFRPNHPRGASVFVETVISSASGRRPGAPPSPPDFAATARSR